MRAAYVVRKSPGKGVVHLQEFLLKVGCPPECLGTVEKSWAARSSVAVESLTKNPEKLAKKLSRAGFLVVKKGPTATRGSTPSRGPRTVKGVRTASPQKRRRPSDDPLFSKPKARRLGTLDDPLFSKPKRRASQGDDPLFSKPKTGLDPAKKKRKNSFYAQQFESKKEEPRRKKKRLKPSEVGLPVRLETGIKLRDSVRRALAACFLNPEESNHGSAVEMGAELEAYLEQSVGLGFLTRLGKEDDEPKKKTSPTDGEEEKHERGGLEDRCVKLYRKKSRDLIFALRNDESLCKSVMSMSEKEIKALVRKDNSELAPERIKNKRKLLKEAIADPRDREKDFLICDGVKCPKCGNRRVTAHQNNPILSWKVHKITYHCIDCLHGWAG